VPALLRPRRERSDPPATTGDRPRSGQDAMVLQVLCSESELGEYGESIAVGDLVSRTAARAEGGYFGTDLDLVGWRFDRYADATGSEPTTISGTVVAIDAVHVRLTGTEEGWTALPGSARLEPRRTTAGTRRPPDRVEWGPPSPPDEEGAVYRVGLHRIEEGDELLSGWLLTLSEERVEGPRVG
jgi:hypothetical protein